MILNSKYSGRILALATASMLAGCGRNDVQVYRVAKETPSPQSAALPAGWTATPPGEMRIASYRVSGKDGKTADVAVVPLPGMAGSDLANVNRWRGQVGAPEVSQDDL